MEGRKPGKKGTEDTNRDTNEDTMEDRTEGRETIRLSPPRPLRFFFLLFPFLLFLLHSSIPCIFQCNRNVIAGRLREGLRPFICPDDFARILDVFCRVALEFSAAPPSLWFRLSLLLSRARRWFGVGRAARAVASFSQVVARR